MTTVIFGQANLLFASVGIITVSSANLNATVKAWYSPFGSLNRTGSKLPHMFTVGSSRLAVEAALAGAMSGWRLLLFNRSNSSRVIDLDPDHHVEEAVITDKFSRLRERYDAPHYPIVLCHGFSGFDKLQIVPDLGLKTSDSELVQRGLFEVDYWYGIQEALTKLGATVLTAKVSAFGTIEDRAKELHSFIEAQTEELRQKSKSEVYHPTASTSDHHHSERFEGRESPERTSKGDLVKINLISHSMGGLDLRYLIHKLQTDSSIKRSYKVASLTTISTPHHGSECADFIVDWIGDNKVLKKLCPPLIYEMTTKAMKKFNAEITDDPDVKYFSYGARFNPKWYNVFNLTWKIMAHQIKSNNKDKKLSDQLKKYMLENDGLVSVRSSHWGTYLGTLDEVDHLDLINWTNRTRNVVDKVLFAEEPKFNAIALYLEVADNLSKRGF